MAGSTDNAARQVAKNWINTVTKSNQWRLQVLSRSYRRDPETGVGRDTPVRIRRFAEGCPASCLREAVDYLLEQAPYTGVLYNGNIVPGSFRPTRTEWRRDDSSVVNGLQKTDGTYTLFQDLVELDLDDDWQGASSGSCTEEVVSSYHWDAADIEDLPEPEQGVTYAIQQVGRSEDGTYNYVLVKRVARTQLNDEFAVSDSRFESAAKRVYRNLYGTPDDPRDDSGAPVSVPDPAAAPAGTTVERDVRPNDDCTFDVTVQTRVAKPETSEVVTAEVLDQRDRSETKRAQDGALPDAPAPSGGVTKKHQSQLRPDGKYDTTESTTTEKPVADAVVTVAVTRKGVRTTTVSKNQKEAAPTTGLSVGDEVKVERTPGDLYTNTVSEWDDSQPMRVGEKCQDDLYTHVHERTTSGATMPDEDDHVEGGVDGHVRTRTTDVDDAGAVIQTTVDKQEQPVAKSMQRWTTTTKGTTYEERNTNQPSPPSHSGKVGSVTTVERTEGGLYTSTVRSFASASRGDVGKECAKTLFEHVDRDVAVKASEYSGHVPAAGGGVHKSVTSRLNDEGSYDQVVTTTTELPVPGASKETAVTLRGTRVTTVNRNMATAAAASSAIGTTVRNDRTDGGRYNQTITTVSKTPVGVVRTDCTQTSEEHQHVTTSNVTSRPDAEVTSSDGVIRARTVATTENGTYDVSDTVRTARAQTATCTYGTVLEKSSTTAYKNASSVPVSPGETNRETRASLARNPFGLVDGSVTDVTFVPSTYGPVNSGSALSRVSTRFGRNVTSVSRGGVTVNKSSNMEVSLNGHGSYDYTAKTVTHVPSAKTVAFASAPDASTKVSVGVNSLSVPLPSASVNQEASLSYSLNDHGSYDYTSRLVTHRAWGPISATVAGCSRTTTITLAGNQTNVPSKSVGVNQEGSISVSRNSHGTYDYTYRMDRFEPFGPSVVSTTSTKLRTTRHYVAFNVRSPQSMATDDSMSTMSVSRNNHCTFDTSETVVTPQRDVEGEASYVTTDCNGDETTHRVKVYRNSGLIKVPKGTPRSASVSASINEFGLFDGMYSTSSCPKKADPTDGHFTSAHNFVVTEYQVGDGGGRYKRDVILVKHCKFDKLSIVSEFMSSHNNKKALYGYESKMHVSGKEAYGEYYEVQHTGPWTKDEG